MRTNVMQMALFWFGVVMVTVFLSCGITLLLTNALIEYFPRPNRFYIGIVFLLYAGFRVTRVYSSWQKIKHEDPS